VSGRRANAGRVNGPVAIWAAPTLVGVASAVGLIVALVLEGAVAQVSGCLALAVPVAAVAWALLRPQRARSAKPPSTAPRSRTASKVSGATSAANSSA
jgi:hypothetical protein